MRRSSIREYFNTHADAAPLAVFRLLFGVLMVISIIRFALNGWIHKLYIEPDFFFSYYGFEWIQPLGGYTYLIFIICGLSALLVSIGYKYRLSIIVFFLSFTYIELMDKTTYLNHYYFVSILSFVMIFLPAHAHFSVDAYKDSGLRASQVPKWSIDAIKLILCIVYFYAGLAKLNSDWLFRAMPLEIWLPSKYSLPILGDLFQQSWTHYAFSWGGAIYDLMIPFLLLMRRTRVVAFVLVVIFHVLTRVLFPIGMFPYIMIVSALIFFDAGLHHKILHYISKAFNISKKVFENAGTYQFAAGWTRRATLGILGLFFVAQLLIPFRYMLYPGELFWTEEGYRFSWRVMLMEKTGYANFKVVDSDTGRQFYVDNTEFLTRFQEKQMSFQPDFILEYAHFLEDHYAEKGIDDPKIYVDSYVALNGRGSQRYVNPDVDLTTIKQTDYRTTWLMPFNDDIKGL